MCLISLMLIIMLSIGCANKTCPQISGNYQCEIEREESIITDSLSIEKVSNTTYRVEYDDFKRQNGDFKLGRDDVEVNNTREGVEVINRKVFCKDNDLKIKTEEVFFEKKLQDKKKNSHYAIEETFRKSNDNTLHHIGRGSKYNYKSGLREEIFFHSSCESIKQ